MTEWAVLMTEEDERIARSLLAGIDAGPWLVFPRRDPNNVASYEEYQETRLDLCRFAVLAVREATGGRTVPV